MLTIEQRLQFVARSAAGNAKMILGKAPLALRAALLTKLVMDYEFMIAHFADRFSPEQIEILRGEFYQDLRLWRDPS